jgi:hypothetical protein
VFESSGEAVSVHPPIHALALVALTAVAAAAAQATGDATLVVRLVVDPAPAGATWTYAGLPSSFQLGDATPERTLKLTAGSYTLRERVTKLEQPPTLTSIACSDPSRDTKVQAAAATATVQLTAGETVTCTFVHRALGPKPGAAALELAQRLAPELHLAAAERYRPLAIQDYLSTTTLRAGSPPRGTAVQTQPTLFTLPITPAPTYLDVRRAQPYTQASRYPVIEHGLEQARPRPTVYWHLARQPSTGRIALEYWFLYLYNDFFVRHEADWEGVTVFLDGGSPLGTSYSQHQGRQWVPWGTAPADARPQTYVGKGTHANYPLAGRYSVRVCWNLAGRHCTLAKKTDAAPGDGATLTPSDYDLHEFGGAGYTGSWGSGSYVLGVGVTKDRITDPRRRAEYSNPFAIVPPR